MKKKKQMIITLLLSASLVLAMYTYKVYAVNKEINLQPVVYTKVEIPPRTKITKDMVYEAKVSGKSIPPNAARSVEEVIGKWTGEGYGFSVNSFAYKDKIVGTDDLPDAGLLKLKKNEESFPLLVDLETSLGNSIMPNTFVDLYFRANINESKNGVNSSKPLFGKVASHVRVVSVKDSQADNVYDGKNENNSSVEATDKNKRTMANLYIFAVTPEQNEILNKAKLLGNIIPVANGKSYTASKKDVHVNSKDNMIKWIDSQSYNLNKTKKQEDKN